MDGCVYFLNQYGWPDGAATAQLLCDVLRGAPPGVRAVLVQGGRQYRVVSPGSSPPVAEIIRLWSPSVNPERKLSKLVGFIAFYCQAMWLLARRVRDSHVVVMTTPPFMNVLGAISKSFRGGKLISWEMDVYPEMLFASGVISGKGVIGLLLAKVARWARRRTDLTLVLGPCMAEVARLGGVPSEKCKVLHNWACGQSLYPVSVPGNQKMLTVLYSGNLGVAHDVDTVVAVLPKVVGTPVRFVFASTGVGMRYIRSYEGEHVRIQGACGFEQLNSVLNGADVGLVTQTVASLGCVVPSKFYGILASGRGVLFIGPAESSVARVISATGCGWVVSPGSSDRLAQILLELAADRERVREAGYKARRVFDEGFTQSAGVGKFWRIVCGLIEGIECDADASRNVI